MKLEKSKIGFPWLSMIMAIVVMCYFYVLLANDIALLPELPLILQNEHLQPAILVTCLLIFMLDIIRFQRNKKTFELNIARYDQQVQEIVKGKSNLQQKAIRYSDHADKLKLFISDRLLEHIEYDEKFLHFKNIASEVRHNGVISYDKVRTALQAAIAEGYDHSQQYKDAIASMQYLWDLLDLSTTDNIAMYVANKLYEAEEHYCQQILYVDNNSGYKPTFYAYDAVINALPDFVDKKKIEQTKNKSRRKIVKYSDNKIYLELEKSIQLLGNINYFVLLMENLINNAQFYSNKKKYGNKYSRIIITLKKAKNRAIFSVYNAGPTINADMQEKICQLGYSTRRNKENNGKGLGLYFVNQIVKGNEGEIAYQNIVNQKLSLTLTIKTTSDNRSTSVKSENNENSDNVYTDEIIIETNEDDQLICRKKSGDKPEFSTETIDELENEKNTCLEYRFKADVNEIEIQTKKNTIFQMDIHNTSESIFFDQENGDVPRWCVEFFKLKTLNKVVFRPLDVTGVRFDVKIPTAESRMDVNYHELVSDEINKLENPEVSFNLKKIS